MEKTVAGLLKERALKTPGKPALRYKEGKEWKTVTWQQYSNRVDEFARSLMALGVRPKDKVSLIGTNSPEWYVSDMAIMTMGATTVPVYFTNSPDQIIYILNHSESKVFIVEDITYFQRIEKRLGEVPGLKNVIVIRGDVPASNGFILSFSQFIALQNKVSLEDMRKVREGTKPDDVDTLLYTSGTTGHPKAVMLTNLNSVTAGENVKLTSKMKQQMVSCSYLPLSHIGERTTNLFAGICTGHVTYFISSYEKFAEYLREIRPTTWLGVPRVWEKLYEGVMNYRSTLPEKQRKMIDWALGVGNEYNQKKYRKERVSPLLSARYFIARSLVIKKLLRALGLDRAEIVVTGGAPTHIETLNFFTSIGLWMQDVYGQTEGHGTTSFVLKGDVRFGSAGKPYPLTKVDIASDGEILVKGDNVSPGYYKDPDLTRETFVDGWLYSGDLGRFDEDGFLWITGRKKDIIITSTAKNITPSKIEALLLDSPLLEHAMVIGDGRKYLTALLTIGDEALKNFAQGNGLNTRSREEIIDSAEMKNVMEKHIELVNTKLSRVEQIKKFKILPKPFSAEGGELTALMKVRRFIIQEKYSKEINDMYA